MQTVEKKITLESIADGAAIEQFDIELQKVLNNIVDPNTVADAVREVTLTVKFKPDERRNYGVFAIQAKCKLAPHTPFMGQASFGREVNGSGVGFEFQRQQQKTIPNGNVTPITNSKGE